MAGYEIPAGVSEHGSAIYHTVVLCWSTQRHGFQQGTPMWGGDEIGYIMLLAWVLLLPGGLVIGGDISGLDLHSDGYHASVRD